MPNSCCVNNLELLSLLDIQKKTKLSTYSTYNQFALCLNCGKFDNTKFENSYPVCKVCNSIICSTCNNNIIFLVEESSQNIPCYNILNPKPFNNRIIPLLENNNTHNLNRISLPLLKKLNSNKIELSSYTPRFKSITTVDTPTTILHGPSAIKKAALTEISECDVVFGLFYMFTDQDYMQAMKDKQTYLILQKNKTNTSRNLQNLYISLQKKEGVSLRHTYANLPDLLYSVDIDLIQQNLVPLIELDPIRFIGTTYYENNYNKNKINNYGVMHCKLMVFASYENNCLIPYASLLGSSNFTKHALNNMEIGIMLHDIAMSASLLNNIIWAGLLSEKFSVNYTNYMHSNIMLLSLEKIISRRDIWNLRPEIQEKYISKKKEIKQSKISKDPKIFTVI